MSERRRRKIYHRLITKSPLLCLTEEDYLHAAEFSNLEVALIKAVAKVESGKNGFGVMRTGEMFPIILFEGHWFHRFTNGIYDSTYPTISYPKWTKIYYQKYAEDEFNMRYKVALNLNSEAAMKSSSWGKFQIMGFNHHLCNYARVDDYVSDQWVSEGMHLECFINFLINSGLDDELREHRFKDFARLYNGAEYWKNKYDEKLENAYYSFV